ncbi:diphthine synthase [Chytriomyces hyalinus]|nr:diphthine synthase [Chytriomyces hyalinus]
MLYIVGLGLGDEKDITVKGLEAVKSCERIYLEHYTSILTVPTDRLEALYGKKILLADREMVESDLNAILKDADSINVAFLVVGDPYGFYDKIKQNRAIKLHTLCLLDIKVKEQSIENMARGRKIYEPPRYMTVNQAVEQLLEVEEKRQEKVYSPTTIGVGMSRIGAPDQRIICGTLQELLEADFGEPLHSLVLAGEMHFLEADILRTFAINVDTFNQYAQISDH